MVSLKDKIRAADDLREELVSVPEWGDDCQLLARELSGFDYAWMVENCVGLSENDLAKFLAGHAPTIVRRGMLYPNTHELVFAATDEEWLANKNSAVLQRLAMKILELSGPDDDDIRAAKNACADTGSTDTTLA